MVRDRNELYGTTLFLAADAKKRDENAARFLVERITPWLEMMLAKTEVPPGITIEDLIQDVWAEVFKGFERFRVEPESSFRGWVLCIANHLVIERWRRARAQKRGGGREKLLLDVDAEKRFEGIIDEQGGQQSVHARCNEIRESVEEAMRELRPRYREVLILRDEDALPFGQVAERMGFEREGPVRALYFRARRERARMLGRFDESV